jgi:hypothetical protein
MRSAPVSRNGFNQVVDQLARVRCRFSRALLSQVTIRACMAVEATPGSTGRFRGAIPRTRRSQGGRRFHAVRHQGLLLASIRILILFCSELFKATGRSR